MYDGKKIKELTESDKITLRRAFGKRVEDISLRDSIAFYSIAPQKMTRKDEQNLFFTITLYCHYREHVKEGEPFTKVVGDYYRQSTDSSRKELETIIDSAYDVNGTFFHRLYSLVLKMESKGLYVDAKDLFYELQYWDSKGKERKKRIAQNIIQTEKGEKNDN